MRKLFYFLTLFILFYFDLDAQTTVSFGCTGSPQTWTVPPCVTSINVVVAGAKGGGANGGPGAVVSATLNVTPGQVLQINVGCTGNCPGGGWNGGGSGGTASGISNYGCGGGGASDIRIAPYGLGNRLIVAGGGGGMGGGDTDANGGSGGCPNGTGGTSPFGQGGSGATTTSGGSGGPPWISSGNWGQNGSLGQGGNGATDPCYNLGPGGGGGGGYYGGGGGGSDCFGSYPLGGGGGGGGSSLIPAGGTCNSNNYGNGYVQITYTQNLPTVSITPSNPAICAGQSVTLTANVSPSGGTFSWSPGGQTTQSITVSPASTTTYTVTYNLNGCVTTSSTTITVNPLPSPTASSNSPICAGQTLNLSATGGVSYSWTGPNGFSSNSQNPAIPNASTAASGTYTVTVTDANGCSNTATTNVTVNPLPNPTASSNSPICAGQTLNLSATGGVSYSWSGPNGFSSNSQNPSIPNASTAASGTYTVTVTNANGCSNSATTNVTINPLPNPTASSNSPICAGQTLNLSATGGVSYSWTGPNGFSSNSQNPSIPNASTAASGTYTVTVTGSNGCVKSATTNVTVNPLPNPNPSSNSPICAGQTLNLNSAAGMLSYSWSGPNGFSANSQNPAIPNASTAASGTYTVTVTDANGCSNTATTNVTVNPLPNPTASSNSPICSGQTLNLSATGGVSYSWTGPNGFSSNSQNPSIPNASTAASGTYTVTVTDANGCSNTATTNVTVNPLPNPTASSNSPICSGQTLNLSATGGVSYSWTGPNGFSSNSQNPSIPNASTAASGTYTVTVTGSNGCINSATTNVTVNPLPNPNPSSNSPICAGQTLNLNAAAGMTSYSWSGPNGFSANSQNPSIPNASTAASGTYTVTVTDANGCSNTASINVLVNASLSLTPSSNSPICQGQTLNLSVSPNGLVSYSWTGPNGFSSNQQNPTINNATIAASGTYSVTAIDANGCQGSATINVTVNPLPTPTASSNSPICAGQTLNLSASGGVSYSWSGPNGFSANSQNPSIPNASTAASGTYTVTVTDANGCSNTATTNVTVNPLPNPTASSNSPICSGQTLNLSASGGVSYSWTGPNGFSANSQNPSIPNASTAASGTYTVTVTDANGCSNTATTNVTVNPLPNPTASSNSPICSGQTLNLSATGGVSYSWSGPNGFSANSQNPSIPNASTAASGTYTVTVTDANGCSNTATTNVTVNPLPNPTASSNSPICSGQTLNLSATGGVSYSWSGPNGFSSNSQNPSIPNASTAASGTYTVTVTNANGCSNSATTNVTVNPLPNPTASSNSPICSGQTLNLSASGGVSYSWSGPNGFSANSQNPSIPNASTAASGTYTVTVTDANGCSNSATTNVTVNPLPVPAFSVNVACPNSATAFVNNSSIPSGSIASYFWSMPGGTPASSNASNPSTVYPSGGSYSVTLVATSNAGCVDSTSLSFNVPFTPVANFSADTVCEGNTTCFTDLSSVTNGTISQWAWNFGDGSPADNSQNPCHAYAAPGSYSVTLVVFSNDNCTHQVTKNVVVYQNPVASFSVNNVCEDDQSAIFVNNSSNASSFAWNFGDGSPVSNAANPTHVYLNPGTFNVQLIAFANTCSDTAYQNITVFPKPVANFSANDVCLGLSTSFVDLSSVASGNITQWNWNFNPGSSNLQNPSNTFANHGAYNVQLIVTTDNNCSDTVTKTVNVWPLPVPDFSAPDVCLGVTTPFSANVSIPSGSITAYAWNFGDNASASGSSVTHTYAADGTYYVKLTATSDKGCVDSITKPVNVWPLPVPDFSADTTNGCSPVCVNFSANVSIASGTINTYLWNLGNGTNASSPNPSACYENTAASPKSFSVSLSATSDKGCASSITKNNFVTVFPNALADFYFSPDQQSIFSPEFQFYNQSFAANQFVWNFGDGSTSNLPNPTHIYNDTGTYTITLLANNAWGCADTIAKSLKVLPEFAIFVPNAFTPDGDKHNNTWRVYGFGIKNITIYVFNRWGDLIWQGYDLDKEWDGNVNGMPAPQGVYPYRIIVENFKGEMFEYIGAVNLIR